MKILYSPEVKSGVSNKYNEIMFGILSSIPDTKVVSPPVGLMRRVIFLLNRLKSGKFDWMILNWHERLLASKGDSLSLRSVLAFFGYFFLYRIASKKIVYVYHNHYPHAHTGFRAKVSNWMITIAVRFSHFTVAHACYGPTKDFYYIPHPLYEEAFGAEHAPSDYYIMLGRIARYKKIHEVIKIWPESEKLIVLGEIVDQEYFDVLETLSGAKANVVLQGGYVDESAAGALVARSRGLILWHTDSSAVVSGGFYLGCTYGAPCVLRKSAYSRWLSEYLGCDSVYEVSCESDLRSTLGELSDAALGNVLRDTLQSNVLFGHQAVRARWEVLLSSAGPDN